jgi:hypothetical protein
MKIIICFSPLCRIVKELHDWSYADAERFVASLKDTEFIKHKNKYYPTSKIKWVKIKG